MKSFIIVLMLFAYGVSGFAADKDKAKAKQDVWAAPKNKKYANIEHWESLQAGVWFGIPKATDYEDVYGLKMGLDMFRQRQCHRRRDILFLQRH
jgi:hypothetical protein